MRANCSRCARSRDTLDLDYVPSGGCDGTPRLDCAGGGGLQL